jgi:hypothetical protein
MTPTPVLIRVLLPAPAVAALLAALAVLAALAAWPGSPPRSTVAPSAPPRLAAPAPAGGGWAG